MTEISPLETKHDVHLKVSKIMLARAFNKLTTVSCVILYFGKIFFNVRYLMHCWKNVFLAQNRKIKGLDFTRGLRWFCLCFLLRCSVVLCRFW